MSIKTGVIRDPVWGEITLLPWEKALLNSRAFNRLHNVLQNSNGYRVYPGARHSRFLHSLGTMHVATQISVGLFHNHFEGGDALEPRSDKYIVDECTEKLDFECNKINNQIHESLPPPLVRNLLKTGSSFGIPSLLTLPLYAIRMAALVHDIGHLPYSHVFEAALEEWIKLKNTNFLKKGKAIHEQIGGLIINYLRGFDEQTSAWPELRELVAIAGDILHGIEATGERSAVPTYPIFKSIISGVVDADRIDYVRRDGELSGFLRTAVDFPRLFRNFIVSRKVNLPSKAGSVATESSYFVQPSPKSKSDLEKVLWERYQEYTYVSGHHRVVLFDEITKRLIVHLLSNGILNNLLDGIHSLDSLSNSSDGASQRNEHARNIIHFLDFYADDSYVDEKIKALMERSRGPQDPPISYEQDHIKKMVTAFCEERDLFVSIFKTDDDFWNLREPAASAKPSLKVYFDEATPEQISEAVITEAAEIEKMIWEQTKVHIIIAKSQVAFDLGFKTDAEAAYALGGLGSFLRDKQDAMRPFNLWLMRGYKCEVGSVVDEIIEKLKISVMLIKIS